jgi:hypothetical protein
MNVEFLPQFGWSPTFFLDFMFGGWWLGTRQSNVYQYVWLNQALVCLIYTSFIRKSPFIVMTVRLTRENILFSFAVIIQHHGVC